MNFWMIPRHVDVCLFIYTSRRSKKTMRNTEFNIFFSVCYQAKFIACCAIDKIFGYFFLKMLS